MNDGKDEIGREIQMLEAKFFRDYKHNYMILPCKSRQPEKSYQCRQLTSNKIEELLRCSMRHVNGMTYFYYDISSRTTMESLYRNRRMSHGQIRELFAQLYGIYCRVGDYFMDEMRLVFLPEYIFYDLSRKKYIGLYYPDYEEDRPYEALMDYLLEHMDSGDERLADCIYQIYERAEDGGFSLWDALQIMGESEESGGDIFLFPGSDASEKEKAGTVIAPMELHGSEEDGLALWGEKEDTPVPTKRKSPFSVVVTAFSILGIAGIAYIYSTYELADREIMTLLGCGALLGVCLTAGLVGLMKGGGKKKQAGKSGEEQREAEKKFSEDKNDRYLPSQEPFFQEHAWNGEMVSPEQVRRGEPGSSESARNGEAVSVEHVLSREPEIGRSAPARNRSGAKEEEEICGNTVFFDSVKMTEYKLYALDKKNKKHIELSKFPFTVGKMAGCVDCVLADDSISRIHARFEKVGDVIQLTDMNSTNGTYRNGLRMQPQETVEIEPGDEIRFGNLNYCYR